MSQLTPEMRAEIERLLRTSSPGFNHGEVFRGIESGLTADQIAAGYRTGSEAVQAYMRSLQHLLVGTIPTSRAAAKTNAVAYRELLAQPLSPELEEFAKARLQRLLEINPDASKPATPPRPSTRRPAAKKAPPPAPRPHKICPDCLVVHAGGCY